MIGRRTAVCAIRLGVLAGCGVALADTHADAREHRRKGSYTCVVKLAERAAGGGI
jgi:hypothetical protein